MDRLKQVRIGTLAAIGYPAFVAYDGSTPWLTSADDARLPEAAEIVEAVALQLLGQHRSGQGLCLLHESVPSPYFAQLKRLFAASEHRWGEQLFTAQQCLKRLTELEEIVHRRFALLAQTGAQDIHNHNANASRREPIIYLLLNGLGALLSEASALRQLETLCRQGPTVGIVPLLLHQTREESEPTRADIHRRALADFWQGSRAKSVGLDMTDRTSPIGINSELWRLLCRFDLKVGVGQLSKRGADHLLTLSQQAQDDRGETDFLHIRIGQVGANPAWFNMGERSDVYHVLIGGATRTGKTTLLNQVILTACETYPPDQLQLSLMDFKDGVSFWEYAGLAHVAALYAPAEDNFDTALQCLSEFAQQIGDRYALFRTMRVARLTDYNSVASKPLPRCLLVVDEAQSLFENRSYQQKNEVKQILSAIAKKGAAAGVHLILSTQSFQNVELEGDVKDQFHLRIGLRHASAMGCRALMGRDNEAMLNLARFTAIYNSHQGEPQHNLTVALEALPDFAVRLEQLRKQYPETMSNSVATRPSPSKKAIPTKETDVLNKGDVSQPW